MENFDYIAFVRDGRLLKENQGEITNYKVKSGKEGPSHDPYGYEEFTFEKDGKKYKVHYGLAQYVEIDGKRNQALGNDYDNFEEFVEKHTGVTLNDLHDLDPRGKDDYEEDPMGGIGDYIEESNPPKEGEPNPTGSHTEREPNGKKSSNIKNKAEKIAKLANNKLFVMELDIQTLNVEERITYIINNLNDQEINNYYDDYFWEDDKDNIKENIKNIVRKTLDEMSITGGEGYLTKYAFKKKNKNGKYTNK